MGRAYAELPCPLDFAFGAAGTISSCSTDREYPASEMSCSCPELRTYALLPDLCVP